MWENMTFENILNDMLSRVSTDVDKREGSVIYDALAPAAYKLAEAYFMLSMYLDLVSGDTAVGEFLDRVAADHGITRKQATYAFRKIETSGPVGVGTRWGINGLIYVITELLTLNEYKAQCEQLGDLGNQYSGELDNIDNISDIIATLTDIITSGEDEETDDNLRSRFYAQIRTPSTSGNADNYKTWALEVPGCGNARVFPLWNGAGTVKVLVVDENMAIDEGLEVTVYDYIETVRPVGPVITVDSPAGIVINVTANVLLDGSQTLVDVKDGFQSLLSEYLKESVFEDYSVSYARIGALLLTTEGVQDYTGLQVNGGTANITIADTEMPIAGTVTLVEV